MRVSQRGFVLIATCIALTILLAMAGFAIDIGRMYVIKSELQAYADAAALSAAVELNDSGSGLTQAQAAAKSLATGPHAMRWDMGTQPITNITTSFSADEKGWQEHPKQAGDLRFVRVVASEPAPVIFMRIFQPLASINVTAASEATKAGATARLIQ